MSPDQLADVRNRRIGFVFQGFNLLPRATALANVELPLVYAGLPREERARRAMRVLRLVGLGGRTEHKPAQLSGGQQQRVAIARALAMHPRAMLFDEVTSALDPELVGEVLDVMRRLVQDGMTMLIVTHEMSFARAFANRVIFMADGEILEQGEPGRLFEHPESSRLQAFLKRFKQGYQL
jgi:polar amino acid transport system ATP-binding protein